MKTIVRNGVSLFLLKDETYVEMGAKIKIGDPLKMTIDNDDFGCTLYEDVTPPDDYRPLHFLFDGKKWRFNENFKKADLLAMRR